MRKRPVLILELLIALTLFTFIMGILFSSFKELTRAKTTLRKDKELIISRQRLQLRLTQILSNVTFLKCENNNCLLTTHNYLDPDPNFRGALDGTIYIDAGRLVFVTWPEKGIGRKEILDESADCFSIQFFDTKKNRWENEYPGEKPFMAQVILDGQPLPLFL